MADSWKKYRVRDIAASMGDAPFGSSLKNDDYTHSGALVVQGKNIQGRTCDWSDRRYVSIEKYNSLPRSHCYSGDLVFPKVGTIGKVGLLTRLEGQEHYILSTNTMRLQTDEKIACRDYVYYYFSWPKTAALIQAMNSKSVQPVFNFTTLRDFEILLPPIETQRRVAEVLGAIDDKIECNRRINQTLEEMARALYKHWFVDFGPFRRSEFVDSALGSIPSNWNVVQLDSVCDVNKRTITPSTAPKTIKYIDIASVSVGTLNEIKEIAFDSAPSRARRVVIDGDTIWSMVRPNRKSFLLVLDPDPEMIVSTGFAVVSPRQVPFSWVYLTLTTEEFVDYLIAHATGAAYPAVTSEVFEKAEFVLPPDKVLTKFHNQLESSFRQIAVNNLENQTLAATRDYLLPKLLSGETELHLAEELLEEVL